MRGADRTDQDDEEIDYATAMLMMLASQFVTTAHVHGFQGRQSDCELKDASAIGQRMARDVAARHVVGTI